MKVQTRQLSCCGIHELIGMNGNTPQNMVKGIQEVMRRGGLYERGGVFIGTLTYDNNKIKDRRMKQLDDIANYLEERDLGVLYEAPAFKNPNTGNMIIPFQVHINVKRF